jgi:hypothetical protein
MELPGCHFNDLTARPAFQLSHKRREAMLAGIFVDQNKNFGISCYLQMLIKCPIGPVIKMHRI